MAKKRAFGEGTIYENKKRNRWEGQFTFTDSSTGKRKRKLITGKTQKEVALRGKQFLQEIQDGLLPNADKLTLGEWLECWLTDYIKPNVRIKSYEKYEACINTYIRPKLGHVAIKKIKAPDVQRVLNELSTTGGRSGKGLSSSTVRTTRRYLSMAFNKAIQVGILPRNVISATTPPKLVKKEIKPLTKEQVAQLLTVAKSGEYFFYGMKQRRKLSSDNEYNTSVAYMVVLIALSTGMRLGEVFGLKWTDINFDAKTISIQRALVSSNTQGMIFQAPKTKVSKRQILLSDHLINELEKYQKKQTCYAELLGNKFINQQYLVFTNTWGNPVDTSNFTSRYFKKMLAQSKLDVTFSFHDLRHTHATLLLRQGVNIKVISERLGHSTITMTLDTYSHLMPDMQQTAVEALKDILSYQNSN